MKQKKFSPAGEIKVKIKYYENDKGIDPRILMEAIKSKEWLQK